MKKKNWPLRILCALLFVALSGVIMLSIYTLSAEDGLESGSRSEQVTEVLKEEVQERLESTPEGVALSERIKAFIILHSPYGSDWNMNVRKLAHFTIYFALATMCYITLAILGVGKIGRILITMLICGVFAIFDELHQGDVIGRTMSERDVIIDSLGALTSVGILTVISIFYSIISYPFRKNR
ncbi:VanZ family protein [Faecalicoccus acidiformans]|uniref:VanZ family protein n=1 Tax=Faecalicoccus acidiformans TaxID=915173 RepID=UPI0025A450E7|nr:VanZ family protein [Faecalicoccus acidiformans]MDM8203676.1 VanZ family protein [Faecalicoccus acidiformans]